MTHTKQYDYLISMYKHAHEMQYVDFPAEGMYNSVMLDLMHTAEKYLSAREYNDFITVIARLI